MCVMEQFKRDPLSVGNTSYSGSGMFSEVAVTECGQYAIKHCNYAFADAWLLYAVKIMSLPEQPVWAPKIHALWIDFRTGAYSALVEALITSVDSPPSGGCIDELAYSLDCMENCMENGAFGGDAMMLEHYDKDWPDNKHCIMLIKEVSDDSDISLFYDVPGNCMQDNEGNLIYNDPVCVKGWRGAKSNRNQVGPRIEKYVRSMKYRYNIDNITLVGEEL